MGAAQHRRVFVSTLVGSLHGCVAFIPSRMRMCLFPMTSQSILARILLTISASFVANSNARADDSVSFRRDIAPILVDHCVACHSAKKAEGGYRVDTFAELIKAGDSGETPIGGEGDHAGELLRRLTSDDESERMPAESEPLSSESVRLVTAWLASGASFDGPDEAESLAFVIPPPKHPDPPSSYSAAIPVTAIAFSPDGNQLVAGGYHEITVWSVADATLVRRIANLGQRVFAIAISPDGATLAVACGEPGRGGEVRLVDYASGEVKAVIARSTDVALDVAWRPQSHELAIASADSLIRIVDTQTSQTLRTLASHADWVTAVCWSSDGTRLASASRDKSAKVFDAQSGELLTSYQGHGAPVRGVIFTPDGQHVLSAGSDKSLHRWEAAGGKHIATVPLGGEGCRVVAGGEGFVLVPVADKRLLQIDLANNGVSRAFTGLGDWALVAAWHGEPGRVAAGAFNGEIRVWDATNAELVKNWLAKP